MGDDVDGAGGPGAEMASRRGNTKKRGKFGSKVKRKRGHEQLMDESDDDGLPQYGDTDPLETGLARPTTTGEYDMSPLHGDSASDSTQEDRQENAIDDEEDHLVTMH